MSLVNSIKECPATGAVMALVAAYVDGQPVNAHAIHSGNVLRALIDNNHRLTSVGVAVVEQVLANPTFADQEWVKRAVEVAKLRKSQPEELPDVVALHKAACEKEATIRMEQFANSKFYFISFWQAYYLGLPTFLYVGYNRDTADYITVADALVAAGKAPTPEDVRLVRGHAPYRFSFPHSKGREQFEGMVMALSDQLGKPYVGDRGIYIATVTPYIVDPLAKEPTSGWLTTLTKVAEALGGKLLKN